MRNILIALLLALGPVGSLAVSTANSAETVKTELQAIVSGKYQGPYSGLKSGSRFYISAKDVGTVFKGQVHWYPVAGRLEINIRGKSLKLLMGSDSALLDRQKIKMPAKIIIRGSRAFVPIGLLQSKEFAAWLGFDTKFDRKTGILTVDRRSTVGPVRWFSYKNRVKIQLTLKGNQKYRVTRRGLGGVDVTVVNGIIDSSERVNIEDGIVSYYSLRQESRLARLSIKLSRPGIAWSSRELSKPRRVVVEIFSKGSAPRASVVKKPIRKSSGRRKPKVLLAAAAGVKRSIKRSSKPRIVIDPGHGGRDGGAVGTRGTKEKDITLKTGLALARLLREEGLFEVMLTRTKDKFVALSERSRMANKFNADLFISLHCNASKGRNDSGYEVYILSETASDPEAARLAEFENAVIKYEDRSKEDEAAAAILVAMSMVENLNASSELAALVAQALDGRVDIKNRGVKKASFYVLKGTNAAAVLHELAYLTNKKDEARLRSAKYRRRIVDGLYAGVLAYAGRQGWLTR